MQTIRIKPKFGTVGIEPIVGSNTQSYRVEWDENGKEISRKIFQSHVVCFGIDHCFICGRVMKKEAKV
jgi:hypothetical protein